MFGNPTDSDQKPKLDTQKSNQTNNDIVQTNLFAQGSTSLFANKPASGATSLFGVQIKPKDTSKDSEKEEGELSAEELPKMTLVKEKSSLADRKKKFDNSIPASLFGTSGE